MTVAWAVHRLSGVASPANAAYSAEELVYQLKSSGAKCLFTVSLSHLKMIYDQQLIVKQCIPLLEIALQAAKQCGIPEKHIYILEMPKEFSGNKRVPFKSVSQLIEEGKNLPKVEELKWEKGQGARQAAYLCYSSGTSGLPVS